MGEEPVEFPRRARSLRAARPSVHATVVSVRRAAGPVAGATCVAVLALRRGQAHQALELAAAAPPLDPLQRVPRALAPVGTDHAVARDAPAREPAVERAPAARTVPPG